MVRVFFLLFGALLFNWANVFSRRENLSWDNPFGLNYVYPYYPEYQKSQIPKLFAEAGLGWVNFADMGWRKIEPEPPQNGRHNYQWETLDKMIRLGQSYGFHIVITLKCNAEWAGGKVTRPPLLLENKSLLGEKWEKKVDKLPAPEHLKDYQEFIKAMGERYDKDGKEDMPGLLMPVIHYQIGNEYVHEGFWGGTVEDYGKLLKETWEALKEASPEVKIILAGIAWNDLFYNDLEGKKFESRFSEKLEKVDEKVKLGWKEAARFTIEELKFTRWYDIVDARGNGPFPHSHPGYIKWVKGELARVGADKETWDGESRCEPQLTFHPVVNFQEEIFCPQDKKIIQRMRKVPYLQRKRNRLWRWYRREQASQLVKVLATRLGSGVRKVFVGYPLDWDVNIISALSARIQGTTPWLGFLDKRYHPQPAFYAYKQFISLISGFQKVYQSIKVKEGIWYYTFILPEKKVHLLWYNDGKAHCPLTPYGRKNITLSLSSPGVRLIKVITEFNQFKAPFEELQPKQGKINLNLSEIPVFLVED